MFVPEKDFLKEMLERKPDDLVCVHGFTARSVFRLFDLQSYSKELFIIVFFFFFFSCQTSHQQGRIENTS